MFNSKNNKNKASKKIIFIMGATGTGKSKLSVDIATNFPAEIINSDKIQFYAGLDIATNKIPVPDRRGVPHHLLAAIAGPAADFSANEFAAEALRLAAAVAAGGKTPVVAGGSNSYLETLVESPGFRAAGLDPLFLHLHVAGAALDRRVGDRVDEMVAGGLVAELAAFFDPRADLSRGIWRAVGVPEMKPYLLSGGGEGSGEILAAAVEEMKENTRRLAERQAEKIRRLREENGWEIRRIDATEVFECGAGDPAAEQALWNDVVLRPALKIVADFLNDVVEREEDNNNNNNKEVVESSFKSIHGGTATSVAREIKLFHASV